MTNATTSVRTALLDELVKMPSGLAFFRLMTLLNAALDHGSRENGKSLVIALHHHPGLEFQPRDVLRIETAQRPSGSIRVDITTAFLGLTGSVSPLPHYIGEAVLGEDERSASRRVFLDLFHHRLLSLLYALIREHHPAWEQRPGAKDRWSQRLLAVGGVQGMESSLNEPLPAQLYLRLLPNLVRRRRSALHLEQALTVLLAHQQANRTPSSNATASATLNAAHRRDESWTKPARSGPQGGSAGTNPETETRTRVHVQPFTQSWTALDSAQQIRLAAQNTTLGRNMILGSKTYDRAGHFRVVLAGLSQLQYEALSPQGLLLRQVEAVIRLCSPPELSHDIELWLDPAATNQAAMRLSGSPLGHRTWLGSLPRPKHTRLSREFLQNIASARHPR